MKFPRTHCALLLGAGLLASSFAALAEQQTALVFRGPEETVARSIGYADLNLRSDAGVAELHRRLRMAATEVCGPITSPASRARVRTCKDQALQGAVAQVSAPALQAYNQKWKATGEAWIAAPAGEGKPVRALLSRR
jgi:UrcA family protein